MTNQLRLVCFVVALFAGIGLSSRSVFAQASPDEFDFESGYGGYHWAPEESDEGNECRPGSTGGDTSGLPDTVPAPYHDIFIRAAQRSNVAPALVAAVFFAGEHASSWPNPPPPYGTGEPWDTSRDNAQGPFQFLPSTWRAYGLDGDSDGDTDIQDLTDGAYGAANYLAANGGTIGSPDGTPGAQPGEGPSIRNAIWHYNHADWYVERVFAAYTLFLAGGGPNPSGGCLSGNPTLSDDGLNAFPLATTQTVIKSNSPRWCYTAQESCHGTRGGDWYPAADIFAPTGTTIVAMRGGVIRKIGSDPLRFTIQGDDNKWYFYNHLLDGSLKSGLVVGGSVEAGQALGEVGLSEDAEGTPPHLHLHIGPTPSSLNISRECLLAKRPSCLTNRELLFDPQPILVELFNKLPE